ncbi:CoA ester lyase [Piscinibacter aquaticus]|uniref:CoA ester lyase n=1 Tax=Piscinibacter aquaticus TaxID=392597 RepID=A0A5C6U2A3_9BURK|nr:CoA ester lyase [Piscinibacter aquaticus]
MAVRPRCRCERARRHALQRCRCADRRPRGLHAAAAPRRGRALLPRFVQGCRERGLVAAVRINQLDGDGRDDLAAAMAAGADVISLPMAERAAQVAELDRAIGQWESELGGAPGAIELLPVCETALGVADLRTIAAASPRIRCALLGAEDLAHSLCAERSPEGLELEHARRRFVLDARAAGIEPIDAPYTFSDADGAVREAAHARRLGYRSKSLVRPQHATAINEALTPSAADTARAQALVSAFEAARARGEDRALVDGLWVEVPTGATRSGCCNAPGASRASPRRRSAATPRGTLAATAWRVRAIFHI